MHLFKSSTAPEPTPTPEFRIRFGVGVGVQTQCEYTSSTIAISNLKLMQSDEYQKCVYRDSLPRFVVFGELLGNPKRSTKHFWRHPLPVAVISKRDILCGIVIDIP